MIIAHHKAAHVVIHAPLVIACSAGAYVRLHFRNASEKETTDLFRRAKGNWREWMLRSHSEPEVTREFNNVAWVAFCQKHNVSEDLMCEAESDATHGPVAWLDFVNNEISRIADDVDEDMFWSYPSDVLCLLDAVKEVVDAQPKPLTIADVAKKAWTAQDASNLSGLVRSWAEWMPVINAEPGQPNTHPVNVIMADKIMQLALVGDKTNLTSLEEAYAAVRSMIEP